MAPAKRYKEIQLAQLRAFCLAARERNFTAAARQLGVAASTVWEQLRGLERMLDCTLLRRRGRAIELTPEGQIVLDLVQPHVEGLESLKRLLDAGRDQLAPQLAIASSQYLLRFHLSGPIQEFTAAYPRVQLDIQIPMSQHLVSVVEDRTADIAICAYEPEEPRRDVLHYEPILELPLQLMTPLKHPLARKKTLELNDILDYPVILSAKGAIGRRMIDRILVKEGLAGRLRMVMQTQAFDTIQQYVQLGVGVGLMHLQASARLLSNLHLRPIPESKTPLAIAMVVRKYGRLPKPVTEFQEIVRRSMAGTQ